MSQLKIGRMVIGMCQTNTYFVYSEGTKEVLVFDPADGGKHIYDTLAKNGLVVKAILLTHGHFDHIWGCNELKKITSAPVYALLDEKVLLEDAVKNVSRDAGRACTVIPDFYIKDLDILEIIGLQFQVLHTPGHTIGSCCYYFMKDGILITGDTLFEGSVGRTDLPTGSMSALNRSIKDKLSILPEDVKIYPGHGESSTIGQEMKYNPYCQ